MSGSSPAWMAGYIPTAAEWNALWGAKVDTSAGTMTGSRINQGLVNGEMIVGSQYPGRKTGIMIPWYLTPANPYTDPTLLAFFDMMRRYPEVPVVVVVTTATAYGGGPGTVEDLNVTVTIKKLKAAGAVVLGYISTGYAGTTGTGRTEAAVKIDVLGWHQVYASALVDGLFFDEMPFDPGFGNASVLLYQRYYEYARANGYGFVVGNPGTNQGPAWYQTRTADVIIIFESSTTPSEIDLHGNFATGHAEFDRRLNGFLAYGQATLDVSMVRMVRKYVNWVFVTADALPNPWDAVPPYIEALFAALNDTSVPGDGIKLLTYAASIVWDASDLKGASVTLTGNATVAAPTGLIAGKEYFLIATQDATGARTLAFNAIFKFPSGTTLPLTATASKIHTVKFLYNGASMLVTALATT